MSLDSRHHCPLWTPLHLHRKLLRLYIEAGVELFLNQLRAEFPGEKLRILDVGCGYQPYRNSFHAEDVEYLGADIPWADVKPDVVIDEGTGRIQSENGAYHGLVHFQTLEHVPQAMDLLRQCHALLIPGGRMFCTVPFAFEYHPVPGDYRRWTTEGLRMDLEIAGFQVLKTENVEGDLPSLLTIIEIYLASIWGYVLTKPLFLVMNLFGWTLRHTRKTTLPLTVGAFAQVSKHPTVA